MRVATSAVSDILYMAVARTRAAEGVDYDTVLTVENQHELFLPLAAAVTTTERVELGLPGGYRVPAEADGILL